MPWIVLPGLHADVVQVSDALTWVSAAPEHRVDFAAVGYSEVG
jgi:hypothetical protein